MNETTYEVIKALAYDKTPQEVEAAMDVPAAEVERIMKEYPSMIKEAKDELAKGGYLC